MEEEYTSPLLTAVELQIKEAADDTGERPKPVCLSYHCANINNKINVLWEIKPVEAARNKYGYTGTFRELKRSPMRTVCVLDISHSMAEPFGDKEGSVSKLERVKMFASMLVKETVEEDFLGFVTFGTQAKVIHPLCRMMAYNKEKALEAIETIDVGGVTNLSEGLLLAVEQFVVDYRMITTSKYFDDNVLLFTDGMANEGITDSKKLICQVEKTIARLKKEYAYPEDYGIRITTLGTGGFLPEMIYELGQAFSSDPFHLIDESSSMELSLFRPMYLKLLNNGHRLRIKALSLNGVTFDQKDLISEYKKFPIVAEKDEDSDDDHGRKSPPESPKHPNPKNRKGAKKGAKQAPVNVAPEPEVPNNILEFYMHDMCKELQRHLSFVIQLPKRHNKLLKGKGVMKLVIECRDVQFKEHTIEEVVMYEDLPVNAGDNSEQSIVAVAEQQNRLLAIKAVDKSADCILKLDRTNAKESLASGTNSIQDYIDSISNLLTSEDSFDVLTQFTQPIISNLEHFENLVGDYNVRWDDVWGRLKAFSSSLSRETPTSTGVCVNGAEMFESREIQKKLGCVCSLLFDVYRSKGIPTDTVDKYLTVVKELEARWESSKDYIPDPEPVMVFNFKLE